MCVCVGGGGGGGVSRYGDKGGTVCPKLLLVQDFGVKYVLDGAFSHRYLV